MLEYSHHLNIFSRDTTLARPVCRAFSWPETTPPAGNFFAIHLGAGEAILAAS
jgi:hypothetical protein